MFTAMKRTLISITTLLALILLLSAGIENNASGITTKAALGKKLFSEKLLSIDSSVSCASCHKPAYAFADTLAFSIGIGGKLTKRNTPSVLNMKNRPYYFWDGRAASLEEQSLMPIQNPDEMGLPITEAVERLNRNASYKLLFKKIFGQPATAKNLSAAFAAYEQTLETVDSKFDDWSNNLKNLTVQEERGRQLFIGSKAKCFDCHFMEDFTDDNFKNIGLFNGVNLNDSGRFYISRQNNDLGKFKTPGLRNIAVTAPYMHNGMFRTLEEVVEYYNDPGKVISNAVNIDPLLSKPLQLTAKEKKELVAFLKTLTDKRYSRQ
ncbi:cytochrome c peroxidase [soil metagenome]